MNRTQKYFYSFALVFIFYTSTYTIWPFNKQQEVKKEQPTQDYYPEYTQKTRKPSKSFPVQTTYAHLNNNLTNDAAQYLSQCGVKPEEFTHFKGTLQQCEINDVFIEILNQSCDSTNPILKQYDSLRYINVDIIMHLHEYNKKGEIDQVSTFIQSLITNKEEHIGRLRTIINDNNQLPEDVGIDAIIFNNLTQDLSIYSTQLLTACTLELILNQFTKSAEARAARIHELFEIIQQELLSIYHPVTKHQQTLIEEIALMAETIVSQQYETVIKNYFADKKYKTLVP